MPISIKTGTFCSGRISTAQASFRGLCRARSTGIAGGSSSAPPTRGRSETYNRNGEPSVDTISFTPIGVIRTPFTTLDDMPIQPAGAQDAAGEILLREEFAEGLRDLDGFSHIHLIYHFHRSSGYDLKVVPFMDTVERGLFSTRAPRRPNLIGLSVVRLESIEGTVLRVRGIDVLDGTPLLDIKPYVTKFDAVPADRFGWLDRNADKAETLRSDRRFTG
ncbi:MAG: tRNA (N6-threonylcarbamoyladenosine(37)-N6)-methyltransferase TrmO [Desulfovibrionaceae bacterium]|nr:tRNA (N6-threonylcarbamoyladenosine(37)-N6)-methyltransferase TrmO [Desulfovibrionaceae bacterium]